MLSVSDDYYHGESSTSSRYPRQGRDNKPTKGQTSHSGGIALLVEALNKEGSL